MIYLERINLFGLTSLLCALLCLLLAIFAYAQEKRLIHRLFFYFNIAVAIWGFGCFLAATAVSLDSVIWGWRLTFLGGFYIATLYYHLIVTFCGNKRKTIARFAYFQSIFFSSLLFLKPVLLISQTRRAFGIHYLIVTPILTVAICVYLFLVSMSFLELVKFFKISEGRPRQQSSYMLIGFFFGFLGGTSILLPEFGIDLIYPIGNIGICIYVIILAYAIFKHQIMDIRIVIHKTLVYFILAALISSFYVMCIYLFRSFFYRDELFDAKFFSNLLLIILISFFVKPMEIFLHRLLDKKFFKGTIMEISSQKEKLETELERRERLKSVGVMAAGMAHEIKNPLATISTFVEFLPSKYEDPSFRQKFERIMKSEIARMTDIVNKLLLFSKPSDPRKAEVSVRALIEDSLELINNFILKKNIEVSLETTDDKIFVDGEQLKQALLNLFMNAIDAMSSGGRLSIEVSRVKASVQIKIADSGCGIEPEKLAHIFDPFYTSKDNGTGLGLAITHAIIEKNSGKILVSSSIGQGTSFLISLPSA